MSSMSPSEVSFERALSEYIYFLLFCVLCMWISTTSYENQWTKQTAGCWTKAANVYIVKVNTKKKKRMEYRSTQTSQRYGSLI